MFGRWTFRRVHLEIHYCDLSVAPQRPSQLRKVGNPVINVVIGIHDQNEIDWLGEIGRFGTRQDRDEHVKVLAVRALLKVAQHVRLNVNSKQLPFRYAFSDLRAEITGSGPKIGDTSGRLKV